MSNPKNVRAGFKGSLTRFKDKVLAEDPETITESKLTVHHSKFEKLQLNIETNYSEILGACADDDERDNLITDQETVEDTLDDISFFLADCVEKLKLKEAQAAAAGAQNSTTPAVVTMQPKLKDLQIPKFSGQFDEWLTFSARFKSAVHNRNDITREQKMSYLVSYLDGQAATLVSHMPLTDDSYDPAWKKLQQYYEDKRGLVYTHADKLLNLPPVNTRSSSSILDLIAQVDNAMSTLETLGQSISICDILVVRNVLTKIGPVLTAKFHDSLLHENPPTWNDLNLFLTRQLRDLPTCSTTHNVHQDPPVQTNKLPKNKQDFPTTCSICKGTHRLHQCQQFQSSSVDERWNLTKKLNLCTNCLSPSHKMSDCKSNFTCKVCRGKHHSALHKDKSPVTPQQPKSPGHPPAASNTCATTALLRKAKIKATADVLIKNKYNQLIRCRAIIDNWSDENFISQSLVNTLQLPKEKLNESITINGLQSQSVATVDYVTQVEITSYATTMNPPISTTALIVRKVLAAPTPLHRIDTSSYKHIQGLALADADYALPKNVDLLLGVEVFQQIVEAQLIKGTNDQPVAQNTKLGWIIYGVTGVLIDGNSDCAITATGNGESVDAILRKFWEVESLPSNKRNFTSEEEACEHHYRLTTVRLADGSFQVRLPFKKKFPLLGSSNKNAYKRFLTNEASRMKSPAKRSAYNDTIQKLFELHHIELVPPQEYKTVQVPHVYYLPHHGVYKEASSTTKLRIVYDGSCKSDTGVSLNDCLMVGPVLQEELISILIRWRLWQIPFTADIKQMYLQIQLHPLDRNFLRVYWRFDPNERLLCYRMTRVTFGLASAPYQAIKTLQTLADECEAEFPIAHKIMKRDFYVDDCLSGANTEEEVLQAQKELIQACKAGKFELRKFSSTSAAALAAVPEEHRETQLPISFAQDESVKTLGLKWNPGTDSFFFQVNTASTSKPLTKRRLLSEIGKVYDPLGLLSPITVKAKVLMQSLWKENLDWDQPLSTQFATAWSEYLKDLTQIAGKEIPRCISIKTSTSFQLHGFSDASEKAYAGVVYLRSVSSSGHINVALIAAKDKVAPVHQISLPRLELLGALLLAEVMEIVVRALPITAAIYGWTDSTIVWHQIQAVNKSHKTFVANRLTSIRSAIPPDRWYHIDGKLNPADLPSRGIPAAELFQNSTWFSGPEFLRQEWEMNGRNNSLLTPPKPDTSTLEKLQEEEKGHVQLLATTISLNLNCKISDVKFLFGNDPRTFPYSSWNRLIRHTCMWIRGFHNLYRSPENRITGHITVTEREQAIHRWICCIQLQAFSADIHCLQANAPLPKGSPLKTLCPFVDDSGALRVGGRLAKSDLDFNNKHPLLLPRHPVTELLIEAHHVKLQHAGLQALRYAIQEKYWILPGKRLFQKVIGKCKSCKIFNAIPMQQKMSDLPSSRVNPSPPFFKTGVDYAGPILLRDGFLRKAKSIKAYIAIFVCFTTKAVNLELVTSLTTEAFIASLRRFTSRHVRPRDIFSDNGSNFVGAETELKELQHLVESQTHNDLLTKVCHDDHIQWHFNPPAAPHMGGLWEAAVKSVKYHLKRVIGSTILNYEEYDTLLKQIECTLNSRPLWSVTSDPNETAALTPGHFVYGQPPNSIPDPDLQQIKTSQLSRWQHLQRMHQHFWNRWSNEYLRTLQKRNKWNSARDNVKIGDVVIILEDNAPPQEWKLGNVIKLHGDPSDPKKLIRTVTVKTVKGELIRPITKLAPLISAE